MASSYRWSDALDTVAVYVKSIPTAVTQAVVVDQLNSQIHKSYPFRWCQASLTSTTGVLRLVNGQQDYNLGNLAGAGFYQMLRVRLSRTDVSPWVIIEKNWVNWLPPDLQTTGSIDSIQAMALEPVNTMIRLDRAASVASGTTIQIDGEYWFAPTKITLTSTVITFPDQYFDVAVEGLKWKYYQLGDDKREPQQRSVFKALLDEMVRQEDWGDSAGTRFPDEGLGASSRSGGSGLFGSY